MRFIEADSPDDAERRVLTEFNEGTHHHMVDCRDNDWQAAAPDASEYPRASCRECG